MSPDTSFTVFNLAALAGWIVLAAAVVMKRPYWRDRIAGHFVPLALSAAYFVLIVVFFGTAEGGYGSLADVQALFESPWVALAGWVHFLAFDLFVGAWIARGTERRGLPRWTLQAVLPLTFLFGPIGLLTFHAGAAFPRIYSRKFSDSH
jgi:hypothetical protein